MISWTVFAVSVDVPSLQKVKENMTKLKLKWEIDWLIDYNIKIFLVTYERELFLRDPLLCPQLKSNKAFIPRKKIAENIMGIALYNHSLYVLVYVFIFWTIS